MKSGPPPQICLVDFQTTLNSVRMLKASAALSRALAPQAQSSEASIQQQKTAPGKQQNRQLATLILYIQVSYTSAIVLQLAHLLNLCILASSQAHAELHACHMIKLRWCTSFR